MVRKTPEGRGELVILDHGLYEEIPSRWVAVKEYMYLSINHLTPVTLDSFFCTLFTVIPPELNVVLYYTSYSYFMPALKQVLLSWSLLLLCFFFIISIRIPLCRYWKAIILKDEEAMRSNADEMGIKGKWHDPFSFILMFLWELWLLSSFSKCHCSRCILLY